MSDRLIIAGIGLASAGIAAIAPRLLGWWLVWGSAQVEALTHILAR